MTSANVQSKQQDNNNTIMPKQTLYISLYKWDILFFIVGLIHILLAPYNKVEESFNTQATHDLLYYTTNIQQYDHIQYPGVVPRTFIGSIILSLLSAPLQYVYYYILTQQHKSVVITRITMLILYTISYHYFRISLDNNKLYNNKLVSIKLSTIVTLITVSQFHIMFYCSRLLPNIYACILINIVLACYIHLSYDNYNVYYTKLCIYCMTATCIIFRCDMIIYCIPLLIYSLLFRYMKLYDIIKYSLLYSIINIFITISIDSIFWQGITQNNRTYNTLTWPEYYVLYFNGIDNRSSDYGISPIHWYFSSVLPRTLLCSLLIIPIAAIKNIKYTLDRSYILHNIDMYTIKLLLPTITFIWLYSILPHKELRFILPAIPMFNIIAAVAVYKIVLYTVQEYNTNNKQQDNNNNNNNINKTHSIRLLIYFILCIMLYINICASSLLLYISHNNYPGGYAIYYLHQYLDATQQHADINTLHNNNKQVIHIDTLAAMTGVSCYEQYDQYYIYDKTENISYNDYYKYNWSYIISENDNVYGYKLINYTYNTIHGFERFNWRNAQIDLIPMLYLLEKDINN